MDYKDEVKKEDVCSQDYLYAPLKKYQDFARQCIKQRCLLHTLVYRYENRTFMDEYNTDREGDERLRDRQINKLNWLNQPAAIRERLVQSYLLRMWQTMKACVEDGLTKSDDIVASKRVTYRRQAKRFYERALTLPHSVLRTNLLIKAYALAVSENNGSAGHYVVTAPTCGACGVLPGVLYYIYTERLEQIYKNM